MAGAARAVLARRVAAVAKSFMLAVMISVG
jgi:hypothetical protein